LIITAFRFSDQIYANKTTALLLYLQTVFLHHILVSIISAVSCYWKPSLPFKTW